ncbi:MAG: hypothetical protein AAGK93_12670 [Pseudomonadota bacterium]
MSARKSVAAIAALALTAGAAAADMPQSFGILEFGPDNTLFVADSAGGAIHAYELPAGGDAPEQDAAFNLLDVDQLVTETLDATGRVVYSDLVVHPVTREAFVSATTTVDGVETGAIVAISRDGSARTLDLDTYPSSKFMLQDTADAGVTFWRDIPAPSLTVTDLDYANGELFVSGVSTGEFASTLRRVPFPFDYIVRANV